MYLRINTKLCSRLAPASNQLETARVRKFVSQDKHGEIPYQLLTREKQTVRGKCIAS